MKAKRFMCVVMTVIMLTAFGVMALGSGESETKTQGDGTDTVATSAVKSDTGLGNYDVEIKSCRLAEDYEGKPIVIVLFGFTNNGDDPRAFWTALETTAYQNGIGLNNCYLADDSANYNDDNKSKEIKKGATIDVEVAYVLNDTTTDVEVEVKEFISLNDNVISKTFHIV